VFGRSPATRDVRVRVVVPAPADSGAVLEPYDVVVP
jgi:hypothetical protein